MEGKSHDEKADIKLKLLQKYKFIIIIDEAFPGYITQQFYDGLIAGLIPGNKLFILFLIYFIIIIILFLIFSL